MRVIRWGTLAVLFALNSAWKAAAWLARCAWRRLRPAPTTYGHDRLAGVGDLRRGGFFQKHGLLIGKKRTLFGWRELRFSPEGHATVIGPPRTGKGAFFVVGNLLDHPGSVICTDPKGELRAITARHRATLGPVFVLDAENPWTSHQLNPLDTIRAGDFAVVDAHHLARLLVTPDPLESAHWNAKAVSLLTGFLLYIMHTRPAALRTLTELHHVVMQHRGGLVLTLQDMARLPYPTVRAAACDLLALIDTNEGRSILSCMRKHLDLWAPDRPVSQLVQASDFSLADFKPGVATLYLSVPGNRMELYAPFLRLFAGLALGQLTGDAHKPLNPVLVLLDEARLLGRLDDLERMVAYGAGVGVRVIPIWQDEEQVRALYGSTSLITQCSLQIYLGVNAASQAAELSRRCGQFTVRPRNSGRSGRVDALIDGGHSAGEGEAGRPVLYPAEILQCRDILAFTPKFPAIRATPMPYYLEPRFKGRFDAWRPGVDGRKFSPTWDELRLLITSPASASIQLEAPEVAWSDERVSQ